MSCPSPISEDAAQQAANAYREHGSMGKAADALGLNYRAFHNTLRRAAQLGLLGTDFVLPGYAIQSVAAKAAAA